MSPAAERPPASSRTLGQLLNEEEERLFVGRGDELELFHSWLEGLGPRPLLNITGPGGIGKTALLAAYKRAADAERRPTVAVDLSMMDVTFAYLRNRLGGASVEEIARRLAEGLLSIELPDDEWLEEATAYLSRAVASASSPLEAQP